MKIIIMCMVLLITSNCNGVPAWRQSMFKHPPVKADGTSNYHPEYVHGWQDGCHTAASSTHNHFMKNFYNFRKDNYLFQTSKQYEAGWGDSYRHCTTFIMQHNWNWHGKRVI
ncbi:MAG: hypothetical protein O3A66_01230 [Proteobacteria bacterium]|nr:hypothetical protein [Pseudomonadota bacterium]